MDARGHSGLNPELAEPEAIRKPPKNKNKSLAHTKKKDKYTRQLFLVEMHPEHHISLNTLEGKQKRGCQNGSALPRGLHDR